jgi:hypothetical protein
VTRIRQVVPDKPTKAQMSMKPVKELGRVGKFSGVTA